MDLHWCDAKHGDRYTMFLLDSEALANGGYDPNDPGALETHCLVSSDDLTLDYCNLAPDASARQSRMDRVSVFTVRFDMNGRRAQVQGTPNTVARTCAPPAP
jgi:hypothetical protein